MLARAEQVLRGNPVVNRHLATTFTGPRLGLAILFMTGGLFALYAALFAEAAWGYLPPGVPYVCHTGVLLGVLIVLLPIKVSGIIEGPRVNRAFDQVVATGVAPATMYWGAWISGLAYAALLLFVTLPFAACLVTFGDAQVWTMLKGYAVLLAYSNVIIAVSLACSVFGREWLSTPLAIAALGGISVLSIIPDRDWVAGYPVLLAELSPVRVLLEQAAFEDPSYHPALNAPQPTLLLWQLPLAVVRPAVWVVVMAIGALIFTIGPGHVFAPGLDNFGAVVLRGDRKRGILGRLRGGLTRRVEMAFFYENARPWTARWGHLIRYCLAALPFLLALALLVGVVWGGSTPWARSIVPQRWNFHQDWKGPVSIWLGGGIVVFWGLLSVSARSQVLAVRRIGRLPVPVELLLAATFAVLLGSQFLCQWLVAGEIQEYAAALQTQAIKPGKGTVTPGQVSVYLTEWWHHLTGMLVLVTNLFLIGRLASRMSDHFVVARLLAVVGHVVMMAGPVVFYALLRETDVSRSVEPLTWFSPAMLVPDTRSEAWVSGPGWQRYMIAHGVLAVVLIAGLTLRYLPFGRGRNHAGGADAGPVDTGVPGSTGSAASGVAGVLLLVLAGGLAGGLAAQEPADRSPLRLKTVSRGFDGFVFDNRVDFYTVLVENTGSQPLTARYRVESFEGSWGHGECLISPGTSRTVRFDAVPQRGSRRNRGYRGMETKVVFEAGGYVAESQPLDVTVPVPNLGVGQNQRIIEQHLVVGPRGTFPAAWTDLAMAGSTQNLVTCAPASLPDTVRNYSGLEVVWITAEALSRLSREQQSALYRYVQLGGTVLFSGGLPAAELSGTGAFERLLQPVDVQMIQVGEQQLYHVRLVEGRDVAIPLSDSGGPVPIMNLRHVGAGCLGHVAFPPALAKMPQPVQQSERFWREFDAALPRGGFPAVCHGVGVSQESGDYSFLFVLGGYYLVFALGLSSALFFLARRRRHRRRIWALIAVVPLVFLAMVPVLIAVAESQPSLAVHTEVTFVHAGSSQGLVARNLLLHSSGKRVHDLSVEGLAPEVFAGVDPSSRYRYWFNQITPMTRMAPVRLRDTGEQGFAFQCSVSPWNRGEVFLFDTSASLEPVIGTARQAKGGIELRARLPEGLRGRRAYGVWQTAGGLVIGSAPVGAGGEVEIDLKPKQRNNSVSMRMALHRLFLIPPRFNYGRRNDSGTRVFLAVEPDLAGRDFPPIRSEDIRFEQEIPRRTAERFRLDNGTRDQSKGYRVMHRVRQDGERFFEILDHRVLLVEIPVVE